MMRALRRSRRLAQVALAAGLAAPAAWAAETVSFKEDVYPLIQIRCLECHSHGGEGLEKSGLDLATYDGLMKGTRFGPIVVPGDAFTSNLMVLVEGRAAADLRMPLHRRRLSHCEIDVFRRWVSQGARNN